MGKIHNSDLSAVFDTLTLKKKKTNNILNSNVELSYNSLCQIMKILYDLHKSNDNSKAQEIESTLIGQLESDYVGLRQNLEKRLQIKTHTNDARFYDPLKLAVNDLDYLKKLLRIGEFYDANDDETVI